MDSAYEPPDLSIPVRVFYSLYGVIGPLVCFFVAALEGRIPIGNPWQSGELKDYAELLLILPAVGPFLPLVAYSAVCLLGWIIRPRIASRFVVRLGIYTGVVLSLQFLVIVALVNGEAAIFAAMFLGPISAAVIYGVTAMIRRSQRFTVRHLMTLTAIIALIVAGLRLSGVQSWEDSILALPLLMIPATPCLCPIVYASAATMVSAVAKRHESGFLISLTAWLSWSLAWLISWKFSIDLMLLEYEKLPTKPDGCYVSAAAAGGHARLVGRVDRSPEPWLATPQMRRLKFLEFALAAAAPKVHRQVRRLYDSAGPPLARICGRNVWFADATYLLLKPLEWVAQGVQHFAGISESQICGFPLNEPKYG